MRVGRVAFVGSLLLLAACDEGIGDRPDALPDPDAARYADAGLLDAHADDAFVLELDAPEGLDAASSDDAGSTADASRDAATVRDAPMPRDGGPSWLIAFCRVQYPVTLTAAAGESTTVYGRVYAAGLTERTGATDTDALLVGEVGYGPDASHPSMPSWTWVRGTANVGYGPGSAGYEPNNDEYQAPLVAPATGAYDFAFRFSGDGGLTWTYCDTLDAGSSDGYQLANAGELTVP